MNEQIHEQLSALMDGELERDEVRFVLKRVEHDAELPLRWARYHVMRQTLRGHEMVLGQGFSDAIMARLQSESALSRPRAGQVWLRWGAGGAIAASVALAALVLTKPGADPEFAPIAPVARSTPASGSLAGATAAANRASATLQTPLLAPAAPVETAPASFGTDTVGPMVMEPRMQPYVIRHYDAASATGQSNFVPYVLLGVPQQHDSARPMQAAPANR